MCILTPIQNGKYFAISKFIILYGNWCIMNLNPPGPNGAKPVLVQIMSWGRRGYKSLSESIFVKFHLNSMWFPRGHSTWIPHEFHQNCWNGNAKAPRPHQFYMRGMNATSAPPAHSLRSSCVNHARFIRNSLATVRWLCVVFRRVFVTHNHAFALFGAFSCLCAEVRGLLVICAWSFRSSCAIHRWFFIK